MSIKINVYNEKAEAAGTIEVSEKIFGVKANAVLIHEAVVAQMANERQVLSNTLDRSEVRGGGKKPWQQKGTGRARAGSSRSPLWIGGGIIFGPTKDRNFSKKINKKAKRAAIFMALSDKLAENNLAVVKKINLEDFKTKIFNGILNNLEDKVFGAFASDDKKKAKKIRKEKRSVLFVNDSKDDKIKYSGRNLVGVEVINLGNINIVDLMKYKKLVLTEDAVKKIEEVYKK